MRKIGDHLKKTASNWLDIPQDVATNVPRVMITGSHRVHVVNHLGVVRFRDTEIRIKTVKETLFITGKGLTIQAIHSEELWVEGEIAEVKFGE
ncbi:hypothetical protein GCM10011571_15150 [Marinithermofilum abyssi]|uniref:Sporulation protein YqfC n=1 Tax=Marinithermofilum abyssi TaxID=1571185 RepID=A0A8J2YAI9_9BACL|nr:YabP/YqfC family sporulation protein [Marinithermofilum abyssi]GGE14656.1 hypothetical protein GCM10011571_15150 [Marinithermofilum abyssi]